MGLKKNRQQYSRYSKEIKLEAIRRVIEEEQPVQQVISELGIRHRDNVYEWIKKYKKLGPAAFDSSLKNSIKPIEKSQVEQQLEELKVEVEALKTYLEILLQGEEDKFKAIQALEGQYPVEILCNVLDVPKNEFFEYIHRQDTLNN